MKELDTSLGGSGRDFSKTVFEMVQKARSGPPAARQEALNDLFGRYWKPAYHYLRVAWAKSNEDSKDLVQAFFLWLVDGDALSRYDPGRAAFRTYLKSLLRHFVQNHDEALSRLKRGGGVKVLKLDDLDAPLEGSLPDPRQTDPDEAYQ